MWQGLNSDYAADGECAESLHTEQEHQLRKDRRGYDTGEVTVYAERGQQVSFCLAGASVPELSVEQKRPRSNFWRLPLHLRLTGGALKAEQSNDCRDLLQQPQSA